MISAPLRTPQLKETTPSIKTPSIKTPSIKTPSIKTPSIKTHGHLALLEWEETLPSVLPTPFPKPVRKSVLSRCYDGGTALLFAITVAALAASLCRF